MLPSDFSDSMASIGLEEDLPSVAEYKVRNNSATAKKASSDVEEAAHAADDSEVEHDQLPAVDEYKASGTFSSSDRRAKFKLMVCITAPIAFAAVCIAVAAIISSSKNSGRSSSQDVTVPKDPAVDKPSTSTSNVKKFSDFIAEKEWSGFEYVSQPNTPQWDAVVWLADFDHVGQEPEDSLEFQQRYAMATFFFALGGREWAYEIGFLEKTHICDWHLEFQLDGDEDTVQVGVDCSCDEPDDPDCDPKTVKRIYLPKMNLVGTLPDEIQEFPALQQLDLYENRITGELPFTMKNLLKLQTLILYDNDITGPIPSFLSELPVLETVNFARNSMSGGFPESLQDSLNLVSLNLDDNSLKFDIKDVGQQPNLNALFLGKNDISGELTEELVQWWPKLEVLDVSDNKLAGTIPSALFNSYVLLVIDLHGNKFSGQLPEFGNSTFLEFLALHDNEVSGPIPDSIGDHPYLRHLDLSMNQFSGEIPEAIGSLSALEYLFLARNPFTAGPLPEFVTHLKEIKDISLQSTNRNGQLPPELGKLPKLVLLDLAKNEFVGGIPEQLTSCRNLHFLILNDNQLTGGLPSTFDRLDNLVTFLIDDNELTANANQMCIVQSLKEYIADCGERDDGTKEIECTCCTTCCADGDDSCNPGEYFENLDPVWDTHYVRNNYKLHDSDVRVPAPNDDDDSVSDVNDTGLEGDTGTGFDGVGESGAVDLDVGGDNGDTTGIVPDDGPQVMPPAPDSDVAPPVGDSFGGDVR